MRFVVAGAAIDGNTVVVSSRKVAKPAAVRYAWANNPLGVNFFSRAGLSACPFRTDDWNPDSQPMAALSYRASGKDAPVVVVFDADGSADPERNIVTYEWGSGDGETGSGVHARHTFRKIGSYVVTLTLTDDWGRTASARTRVIAIAPGKGAGNVLCERWRNVPGTDVKQLQAHWAFPRKPDSVLRLKSLEIPDNWGDNYGARVRSNLHPPATGDYTFRIASDDSSRLLLSADEDPARARVIAEVAGNSPRRKWSNQKGRKSTPIRLTGDKRYCIEVLYKEGAGRDHMAVAWEGPGVSLAVIDGLYLSPPAGD